jgi:hypothetical protein
LTAAYLGGLLGAYDASPLPGESFALFLRADLDDPTTAFGHLDVVGRRLLPPVHLLRSAALTIDPFFLTAPASARRGEPTRAVRPAPSTTQSARPCRSSAACRSS